MRDEEDDLPLKNRDTKTPEIEDRRSFRPATLVAHGGPRPTEQDGVVNPPIYRASTIIYDTVEAYKNRHNKFYDSVTYGLYGTKTTFALSDAISVLENASNTLVVSSGTAAIALSLAAFLSAGDHVLVADCIYGSTRKFLSTVLSRFGVEVTYFDPTCADGFRNGIKRNTRVVFLESPGSQLFEMIDTPAIASQSKAAGLISMIDNTWATPLFFRPLDHGVDVSIQAGTKYLAGHSDTLLGAVSVRDRALFEQIKQSAGRWGNCASPDDCYLVHRGIRTLAVRMERHQRNAERVIEWLSEQPEILRIRYPALETDPGYSLWRRDFSGASGLFSFEMKKLSALEESAFYDHLSLFGIGSSWGGFESLLVPAWPTPVRIRAAVDENRELVRVHAGLEDPADLIADLDAAFQRVRRFNS